MRTAHNNQRRVFRITGLPCAFRAAALYDNRGLLRRACLHIRIRPDRCVSAGYRTVFYGDLSSAVVNVYAVTVMSQIRASVDLSGSAPARGDGSCSVAVAVLAGHRKVAVGKGRRRTAHFDAGAGACRHGCIGERNRAAIQDIHPESLSVGGKGSAGHLQRRRFNVGSESIRTEEPIIRGHLGVVENNG